MIDWVNIKQFGFDYFLSCKKPNVVMPPLEASQLAINYIVNNYPAPYTLMLSGGVDSQAMLYAWHISGINFLTLSATYNNNLNYNDLKTLIEFSQQHHININFTSFDLFNFLFTEHENYVHTYRCGSPHMTTFMKISEYVKEGTVIMSGNIISPRQQVLPITKNNFGLYKYAKETKRPIVPFFFLETDQLAFSFAEYGIYINPRTSSVNALPIYHKKVEMYQKAKFPVIAQEQKFTGFEEVKNYCDLHYKDLVTLQDKLAITPNTNSKRTFDLLFRNKYECKYSADKYISRVEYA